MKAVILIMLWAGFLTCAEIGAIEPAMESALEKLYRTEEESAKLNLDEKAEVEAHWRAVLTGVNRIIISSGLPPIEKHADSVVIEDAKIISQLITNIRPALSKRRWPKPDRNFEEASIIQIESYCQCLGDFRFALFSDDKVVAELTVHHGKHIRSKVLGDCDLEEASFALLYALANWQLPFYRVDLKQESSVAAPKA